MEYLSVLEITTITGIKLRRESEIVDYGMGMKAEGAYKYFVNGVEVDHWTYSQDESCFPSETLSYSYHSTESIPINK